MISIITPVFNKVSFIEGCILNVISQRCGDIEHVIIDGGSTDGTVEIIKKYAEKYPHIVWISERDKGQSDAMNKGIALSKGTIISFLNADDFFEPDALNTVQTLMQDLLEPGLLVGNCNVWDEDNTLLYVNKPNHLKFLDLLVSTDIFMHPVNPSAYFYHKSLHALCGMYDVEDSYSMDVDFLFRSVQVANVRYVDITFGNFRIIPGTKTYEDIRAHSNSRIKSVIEKFENQLSFPNKCNLAFRRLIHHTRVFISRNARSACRKYFQKVQDR